MALFKDLLKKSKNPYSEYTPEELSAEYERLANAGNAKGQRLLELEKEAGEIADELEKINKNLNDLEIEIKKRG